MPLLYGEGATKAFARLQEQIIARSSNETIFAWTTEDTRILGMLAESPSEFANSGAVSKLLVGSPRPPSAVATYGLHFSIHNTLSIHALYRDWFCASLSTTMQVRIAAVLLAEQSRKQVFVELWRPNSHDGLWRRRPSPSHRTRPLTFATNSLVTSDSFTKIDLALQAFERFVSRDQRNSETSCVVIATNAILHLAVLAMLLFFMILMEYSTRIWGLAASLSMISTFVAWLWYHHMESIFSLGLAVVLILSIFSQFVVLFLMVYFLLVAVWHALREYRRQCKQGRHTQELSPA